VKAIISKEGRHFCRFLDGVVVGEFSKWQQFERIVLIVVAKDAEIHFKGLIHVFYLTVRLRMKSGGFPRVDFENQSERELEI